MFKIFMRNRFIFLAAFLFSLCNTFSQSHDNLNNLFSSANRLKFGNYLFSEKDYLRALNEFREYLKTESNDTIRFKFAYCFLSIGRYEEAAENFKGLFFNSTLEEEAKLQFFRANFLLSLYNSSDFFSFRDLTEKQIYASEKYALHLKRLKFISHFFDYSLLPDTNEFFSAFDDSNYTSIKKFYLMKKYPGYKSQTTAGLLSAIVPGLGKIYTGEITDGITAFAATGLLVFLAVNNFNHHHEFRGWLFTGLSVLTYAGNIYGSVASAQIYNARVRFNFKNEVKLYFEQRDFLLPKIDFLER